MVQEYELKKVNCGNRKRKLKQIEEQIRDYRRKIEEAFNPQAYREHQMKVFEVQMKNEMLNKNIDSVRRRVKTLEVQTEQCERSMSRNKAFEKIGRIEGTGTSLKRKKVHLHTHTEGFFLKCSKITPSKINMSMSIVGNE